MAWQQGRLKEKADDPEDDSLVTHLGGLEAPCVRITVLKKGERNTDVEYTITTKSKNMKLTDEMIESLRAAGEPSPEDLAKEREEYNRAREDDDTMPEWQDFFAYGYDLMKIFKHTPIREEKPAEAAPEETTSSSQLDMSAAENDDDVPEAVETTSKAKAAPKAKAETKAEAKTEAKEAKVETETEAEEANPFADDETDADLDWAN
jgi:membrane protein involved in colicin uptake